jgi:hypothetical protein
MLLARGGVLRAQDTVVVADAGPGSVGRMLRERLADPRTHVVVEIGQSNIAFPRDSIYRQNLLILASRVTVAGQLRGDIVVVGGDLFIHPGAIVEGRATAIGGAVYPSDKARIDGGTASYRDFGFDATRVGRVIELRYAPYRVDATAGVVSLPGIYGIGIPTYDRSNGVSLTFGPAVSLDSGRLEVRPAITYRSQLGEIDPSVAARAQLNRRTRVEAVANRGTFTNDRWIVSDILNSVHAVATGRDARNWYRADRADVTGHRLWELATGAVTPFVGARIERGWSVRPDSNPTSGPWSLRGRRHEEGMFRPNPQVSRISISSLLAGAHAEWDDQGIKAFIDGNLELPVHVSGDLRFVQATIDGQVRFPTFGTQRFRMDVHGVLTLGDQAPRQRWAYLGGTGTIGTMDLLSIGGDQLLLIDSRYEIPVDRIQLPLVGAPVVTLRHVVGSAGVGSLPDLVQMIGLRLTLGLVKAEILVDTKERKPQLKAGLSLTR